jgi:hypothetical protein
LRYCGTARKCEMHNYTSICLRLVQIARLLEEYNQLDHEDVVGGVKTRFRYRAVDPINDGLDVFEILSLSDKDLNSVVGLRKLAPYQEKNDHIKPNYKALGEVRLKLKEAGLYIDKRDKARQSRQDRRASKAHEAAKHREPAEKRFGVNVVKNRKGTSSSNLVADVPAVRVRSASKSAVSITNKKKRPGPALRRALKEQAAPDAAAITEDRATGLAAMHEKGDTGQGPLVQGKRKREPAQVNDEDSTRRRLESYGKLTFPGKAAQRHGGTSSRHGEATQGGAKSASGGHGGDKLGGKQGVDEKTRLSGGHTELSKLPKAAKKNAKRAMSRQQQRLEHAAAA